MYGWPPGYNKANSAELSRQLVPQHVLPLVLPRPRRTPPALRRLADISAPPRTPRNLPYSRLSHFRIARAARELLFLSARTTEYIYTPPRRAAHVRLLKRFHPEESGRAFAIRFTPRIPFIVGHVNERANGAERSGRARVSTCMPAELSTCRWPHSRN